jgi:hypothetical protein
MGKDVGGTPSNQSYLEIITEVIRQQKITSKELFGIETTQAGFGPRVKELIEAETCLPAPEEILGVKIEYSEH